MNKRSHIILRAAFLSAVGLGLMGCESLRQSAGVNKSPPDEFAVLTKAPLIIPPDYNLHPPAPGAAPINQQAPTEAAQTAMFGSSDPQTVAAGMTGNFTPAEKLLLASAGVQNADPAIRAELQSDQKSMQGADESFTDKILYGTPDDTGNAVDADAEAAKAKNADKTKSGAPAKPDDSATIQKKTLGSWFDWF